MESPPKVETVDARGRILVPGMVDTHRHMWEAVLRGYAPHHTLEDYMSDVLGRIGPVLTPQDVHVGTLLSARAALLSGVTTIQDISNIQDTPAHTDAVVAAHQASGLRTMFAYGKSFPAMLREGSRLPVDVHRVRTALLPDRDALVTLALDAEGGDDDADLHNAVLSRELDVPIARHFSARNSAAQLRAIGALRPGTTFIHGNGLDADELAVIADSGGSLSISPAVELMMGQGEPMITMARGRVPLSRSVDVEVTTAADMFTQMRAAYQTACHTEHGRTAGGVSVRDILELGTLAGARALGLAERTGSITPGKQADLLLLRADRPDVAPVIDPYSTVVLQMDRAHVDFVLVAGQVMVRDGCATSDDSTLLDQARRTTARLATSGLIAPPAV